MQQTQVSVYRTIGPLVYFSSGRVIDWSIDFLKTASGASEVYSVDYTSALLEEGGKLVEKVGLLMAHVSRMRKCTMWFSNRFDTYRAVQTQKMARGWKFWI